MVDNKVRSQDIIKGLGAGLCLLDRDFRILWINKYQADWFGAPHDIYGKHCYKIFQRRSHICPGCPTRKVFKTGTVQIAKKARGFTKNGQKRYYQLTVSPIKDNYNRVGFALELVQDVTEQVIQQRSNLKIIQKLKHMYQHLSSVNSKLRHNIQRLKDIARHMSRFKSIINKKYHQKINELSALKEELQDIFKVNHVLSSSVDLKKLSSLITRLSCELTHADACILKLLADNKEVLVIDSTFGINDSLKKRIPVLKIGEGISGRAIKIKRPLVVYDISKDLRMQPKFKELVMKEGFNSMLSVPVLSQDKPLGVITVFSKKIQHFSKNEVGVLSIFASQVAMAIEESRHYEDIHKNYFDTVHALVLAEEARDPYTRGHTERVTKYAIAMARNLHLSDSELEILRYAGEVHDVGKISIPDFILGKPGRLTPAERAMVELHPVKGAEMLEPLEFLRPALPGVRHHHERYDGTGYPDGLEKEKIPLMARILACADAFDAMTSDRPYRSRKLTVDEALLEIKNNSGSQFDPRIAHSFIHFIRSQK